MNDWGIPCRQNDASLRNRSISVNKQSDTTGLSNSKKQHLRNWLSISQPFLHAE